MTPKFLKQPVPQAEKRFDVSRGNRINRLPPDALTFFGDVAVGKEMPPEFQIADMQRQATRETTSK